MAINERLAEVVFRNTGKVLMDQNPDLRAKYNGNIELAGELVRNKGIISVDKSWKFKVCLDNFRGYGYELHKKDEDKRQIAERIYKEDLKKIREISKPRYIFYIKYMFCNIEHLLQNGIEDNNFGWYVTKLHLN